MTKSFALVLALFGFLAGCSAQKKNAEGGAESTFAIGFYNLENLCDTINDPNFDDDEFTPTGKSAWNTERYLNKLNQLSRAIDTLTPQGAPAILGICEIENRTAINDLLKTPRLAKYQWGVAHFDCKYNRGMDVALVYQSNIFKPYKQTPREVKLPNGEFTRDILVVEGVVNGRDSLAVVVNHWPSRRSSDTTLRVFTAKIARQIVDELMKTYKTPNIVLIGDFNDEPFNGSIVQTLRATAQPQKPDDLFNASVELKARDDYSFFYFFEKKKNLFDQTIMSQSLRDPKNGLQFLRAETCRFHFLLRQGSDVELFSTFAGKKYLGGYSDHLPSVAYFRQMKKS